MWNWLKSKGASHATVAMGRAVMPLAGLLIVYSTFFLLIGPDVAEASFYEAAAQIIPVLLLVLALEARFFAPRDISLHPGRKGALTAALLTANRLGLLLNLAIGEVVALAPLITGDATQTNPHPVYASMATTSVAIMVIATTRQPRGK